MGRKSLINVAIAENSISRKSFIKKKKEHKNKQLVSESCHLISLPNADLLLLLLNHFSRVRLCATPETAAHEASPSLGFSRQEHWNGLPFPSPMHESEK